MKAETGPIAAASALEVFTGAALVVDPSLLASLLFGEPLNAVGAMTGRTAGLALTCAELANTYQGDANDLMSWYSGRTGSTIYDGAPIGTAAGLSALLTGKAAPPLNECGSE